MPDDKRSTHRERRITIGSTYYDHHRTRLQFPAIPSIRMRGYWIARAGFEIGDAVEVRVKEGEITLRRKGG